MDEPPHPERCRLSLQSLMCDRAPMKTSPGLFCSNTDHVQGRVLAAAPMGKGKTGGCTSGSGGVIRCPLTPVMVGPRTPLIKGLF